MEAVTTVLAGDYAVHFSSGPLMTCSDEASGQKHSSTKGCSYGEEGFFGEDPLGTAFEVDSEAGGKEGLKCGGHERAATLEGFVFGAEVEGWRRQF